MFAVCKFNFPSNFRILLLGRVENGSIFSWFTKTVICVGLPDILLGKRNKIFIKLNIFFPTQSLDTSTSFSDVLEMKLVRDAARKPQAFMERGAGVQWVQVLLALGRLQNPAAALGDGHP